MKFRRVLEHKQDSEEEKPFRKGIPFTSTYRKS